MSTGKELRLDLELGTPKMLSKDTKEKLKNERETLYTQEYVRKINTYRWTDIQI